MINFPFYFIKCNFKNSIITMKLQKDLITIQLNYSRSSGYRVLKCPKKVSSYKKITFPWHQNSMGAGNGSLENHNLSIEVLYHLKETQRMNPRSKTPKYSKFIRYSHCTIYRMSLYIQPTCIQSFLMQLSHVQDTHTHTAI